MMAELAYNLPVSSQIIYYIEFFMRIFLIFAILTFLNSSGVQANHPNEIKPSCLNCQYFKDYKDEHDPLFEEDYLGKFYNNRFALLAFQSVVINGLYLSSSFFVSLLIQSFHEIRYKQSYQQSWSSWFMSGAPFGTTLSLGLLHSNLINTKQLINTFYSFWGPKKELENPKGIILVIVGSGNWRMNGIAPYFANLVDDYLILVQKINSLDDMRDSILYTKEHFDLPIEAFVINTHGGPSRVFFEGRNPFESFELNATHLQKFRDEVLSHLDQETKIILAACSTASEDKNHPLSFARQFSSFAGGREVFATENILAVLFELDSEILEPSFYVIDFKKYPFIQWDPSQKSFNSKKDLGDTFNFEVGTKN